MGDEILTAAIEYKKRGWIIHPLSSPKHIDPETGNVAENAGKAVLIKNWSQKETVSDAELTEWFSNKTPYFTDCNIGLLCGKRSDVTVLDLDHMLFIEELFNGFDLVTLRSKRTEGRGHVYFKYTDKFPSSKHHCLGIEVLNDAPGKGGNNVVIAPSVHKSGDVYKWNDPTTPIIAMPQALQDNLMRLFAVEAELKKILAKCRTCFRKFLDDYPDNIPDVHGMTGRRYMLAIATDLKKNSAKEPHIKMFSRLLYREKYDETRTLSEWSNVDETKPWQCATMRTEFSTYIDTKQCERCRIRREDFKGEVQQTPTKEIVLGEKICGTCLHRPGTGAGGCKNPENKIIEGKKKVGKYVTDVSLACDKYLEKPKKIKEIKEKIKPDISQALAAGMGAYHGNLELAEEFQKISPIYYDSSKNYWLWMQQEGYYKRIDETDILSAIRQRTGAYIVDSKLAAEILRGIQVTGRERRVKDVPTTWIHTHSGIIDYVTGAAIKASPEYFLTRPIPHKIGVCDSIPTITKLFKDWVGDQDLILYEWLTYTLITDYPMHRMMILFGSGRNGKGEYADLLTKFVGGENTVSTDLEKLMESRFETSKLYRKKLAIIDETDFDVIKNTARVKAISGHSRIGGEFKGKDGFDFYNTAKITILSNNLPESQDKTEAFYGRCIIQEFRNKFDEGKSVTALIPEIEYENLLYKCIKMLPDLMSKGKFTNEGTIEQKAVKYEHMSNPFPSFLKKELVEEVNGELPIWVVRDLYEVFCTKNGFRKISDKEFTRLLKTEGYTIKRTWWGKNYWNTVFGFNTKPSYIFIEKIEKENLENKPDEPDKPLYPTQEHMGKRSGLGCLSGLSGSNPEQTVTESNTKETANQVRKLPELLCTARQKYEIEKGVVNGSNLTDFCLWVCEHYHPRWQNGTETGYYQPSGIKGIASKIFGLTPESSGAN